MIIINIQIYRISFFFSFIYSLFQRTIDFVYTAYYILLANFDYTIFSTKVG